MIRSGFVGGVMVMLMCVGSLRGEPSNPAAGLSKSVLAPPAAPTFNRDIAPIFFAHCAGCHHAGEVAPFSLLTYADARKHSGEIVELTGDRRMPPWKPEHGYGDFVDERRLTDTEIATIATWVKAGRPEGDAADLPPEPKFSDGWQLGEPDLVVRMPRPYTINASGNDVFRSFVIPLNLPEDRYVEAIEFRPSNRRIVHHALLELDSGGARKLDGLDGEPGFGRGLSIGLRPSGSLGGWAPGVSPRRLPDGVARLLPKGTDLVIQAHFHPSGKIETEQSTIGIYFAKKTPDKILVTTLRGARSERLNIAPGDNHYEIEQTFTVPTDVKLQAIFPHAHLVCREIEVNATLPDGKDLPLIWIKDWNWDWQDEYVYARPLDIPRGTQVHMRFRYDNSEANIKNPSKPPRRVHWGEQTSDEMGLCFFQILVDRPIAEAATHQRIANSQKVWQRWLSAIQQRQKEQAAKTDPSNPSN